MTDARDSDPVLDVRDLTVEYDGMTVLDGLDLEVCRGECLGVLGEPEAGKSTLCSALLAAVDDPGRTSGSITFYPDDSDPVDVLDLEGRALRYFRWERVSLVGEDALVAFNPSMRVRGHVEDVLRAHGASVRRGIGRASSLLDEFGLDPDGVLEAYPHELSGGAKLRAQLALALVLEPDVLVVDEPPGAIELLGRGNRLASLRDRFDLTVVLASRDLTLVAALADRLAALYGGEIVETGPTADVTDSPAHPYTRDLVASFRDADGR